MLTRKGVTSTCRYSSILLLHDQYISGSAKPYYFTSTNANIILILYNERSAQGGSYHKVLKRCMISRSAGTCAVHKSRAAHGTDK